MPDHALRREFVEGVNALREKVLKNAGPKVYNGQEISSGDFTIMLETYV